MRDDGARRATQPLFRLLPAIGVAALLVIGTLLWSPGLDGPYHFDDRVTPLDDPASQSLAAWWHYLPQTLRPLTKLSYALEAEAGWSAEPAPRRIVSLLFHALTTMLLFQLILRLQAGITPLASGFLAALWFLHPVHADSVLLLSGRSAVLAGMLLLAALLALERSRPMIAASLFVLACLARETALAGLVPLAVLAASRPAATPKSALWQLLPSVAGGVMILCWPLSVPRYVSLAEFSFLGRPFWSSVFAQIGAVPVGLSLLLEPSLLSIDYGIPLPTTGHDPLFIIGLLMLFVTAGGILFFLRRARAAALGLAMWLAALLPTQSVIPKLDALTNRPLSLALAGLLLAIAPALALTMKHGVKTIGQQRVGATWRWGIAALSVMLLTMLGNQCARRSELFESELGLWQDAAAKSQTNARPHLQYAMLLIKAGRGREAWQSLSTARAIDPFSARIEDVRKANRPNEDTQ